jgi:hypothetical protein
MKETFKVLKDSADDKQQGRKTPLAQYPQLLGRRIMGLI